MAVDVQIVWIYLAVIDPFAFTFTFNDFTLEGCDADASMIAWSSTAPTQTMFLSVISILEIELEILRIERKDHTQAGRLRLWLEGQLLGAFDARVLQVDIVIARQCAELHVPDPR